MGVFSWLKDLFDLRAHNLSFDQQSSSHHTGNNADADLAPPAYSPPPLESLGNLRITFQGTAGFPTELVTGSPPCLDLDGVSPVFFGSAHFADSSVHPCKIAPALSPSACRVPYGSKEHHHNGAYTLLPFNPETMELVPASGGCIPKGRRPIVGGHEKDKSIELYHAVAKVPVRRGIVRVPGKTAPHLFGCNFAWGGIERVFESNYEILCWKEGYTNNAASAGGKSDTLQDISSDSWKR